MRVFASTPLYPPGSRVGASLATHQFLRGLAGRGHEVTVMPWMQPREPLYSLDGVSVTPRSREIVQRVEYADVVISHLGDNGLVHRLARSKNVPSVRLIHSPVPEAKRLLKGAALVVANSRATAAEVWPGALVCPPATWPDEHRATPGGSVTLVNLNPQKGAELFWELAETMPHIPFVGVHGAYGRQVTRQLPNVHVLPVQADMRPVWAATRILLMPSERESWGMVGIEAMCSGIPVIAHPTPGLRESLGEAGIFIDRLHVDSWQRMIRRLLERPSSWEAASRMTKLRVKELDPAGSVDRFCDAVEHVAKESSHEPSTVSA